MSGRCVCSSVHTHTLKQQLLRLNIHVFTKISVEILWEHFQPKGLTWATSSRPNTTTDSHHVCSLGLSVVQNNSSVFFIPSSTYGKRAGSEFRIDLIPRLHSLFSALFWHNQVRGVSEIEPWTFMNRHHPRPRARKPGKKNIQTQEENVQNILREQASNKGSAVRKER